MSGTSRYDIDIVANNKASRALGNVTKELNNIDKSAKSANGSFGKMAGLAAGVASALGGIKLASSFLETAKSFENLNVQLKFITGSAQQGAKALEIVEAAASKSAFAFEDMANAAPSLLTVSEVSELGDTLDIVGDIAAATGLGFQETASQIQRAFSGGIASADIFREKGVKAMLGFQEGVQYTAEETEKLIRDAFENGTTTIKGATAEMAKTWTGQVSMMGDAWTQFQKKTMEAGLFPALKRQLGELDQFIKDNQETIDDMAVALGEALASGIIAIGEAIKFIAEHSDKFKVAIAAIIGFKLAKWAANAAIGLRSLAGGLLAVQAFSGVGIANIVAGIGAITAATITMNGLFGETAAAMSVEEIESNVSSIRKRIEELNAENKVLEQQMNEMGPAFQDLTVDLGDMDKGFHNLEDAIVQIPSPLEHVTQKLGENASEVFLLEKELETLETTLALAKAGIEEVTKATHPFSEGMEGAGKSTDKPKKKVVELSFEMQQLLKRMMDYPDAIIRMNNSAKAHAKHVEDQVVSMKGLYDQFNPLEAQTREYNQRVRTLNYLITNNIGNTDKWKKLLAQLHAEFSGLNEVTTRQGRFNTFFDNLLTGARESAEQIDFVQEAAKRLDELLKASKINIDQYAQAKIALGLVSKDSGEKIDEFTKTWESLRKQLFPTLTAIEEIDKQIKLLETAIAAGKDETGEMAKALKLLEVQKRKLMQGDTTPIVTDESTDAILRIAAANKRAKKAMDDMIAANKRYVAQALPVAARVKEIKERIKSLNKQIDMGIGDVDAMKAAIVEFKKELYLIDPAFQGLRDRVAEMAGYPDAILRAAEAQKRHKEEIDNLVVSNAELYNQMHPYESELAILQQQLKDVNRQIELQIGNQEELASTKSKLLKRIEEINPAYIEEQQALKKAAAEQERFEATLKSTVEGLLPTVRATNRYEETIKTLNRALDQGLISQETHTAAVNKAKENFAEATKEMMSDSDKFIQNFNENFNEKLADGLVEGNLSFDTFAGMWKSTLKDLITDTLNGGSLLNDILGSLGKLFGGGGGGNILGGILDGGFARNAVDSFSQFAGDFVSGHFARNMLYADGGHIAAGKTGIVGEAGPELVTGPAQVYSNEDSFGPGSATPVNITIQAIDTQTGTEFLLKNKRQIEGIIQGAYNRRGKQGIY